MSGRRVAAFALMSALAPIQAGASVVISADPTSNMNCSAGVCTPTAKNAVLNASDLVGMLSSGDVTVETGKHAGALTVESSISWTSASRLTLDSKTAVNIKAPVVVAGDGALTIVTNDGGSGGDLRFSAKGHIDFWDLSSSLVINTEPYVLVGDIIALASGIASTPNGNFALAADYDAKPIRPYRTTVIPTPFGGTFEGLGHTISHLRFLTHSKSPEVEMGLFAEIETTGTVRDIGLPRAHLLNYRAGGNMGILAVESDGEILHSYVEGSFTSYGVDQLSGLVYANGGTISDCHVAGTLAAYGNGSAAGLVALNGGIIDDSFTTIQITAGNYVGGLAFVNDGTISNSHASGAVSAYYAAGGLVYLNKGLLTRSYATNAVSGQYVGGLVESTLPGTISQSYATGNVTGIAGAGGLVGATNGGTIEDSYATGSVTVTQSTNSEAGGLVAYNTAQTGDASIQSVYSIGAVSGAALNGGLIGKDTTPTGGIASAYWDMDTSGITNPSDGAAQPQNDPGITGLSNAALKSVLPAGFDPAIWGQNPGINNGYPYLLALPPR